MQISEHSVRERAYYIWEDEGRVHGRATVHWLRAESELHAVAAPVAVEAARAPAKAATKVKAAAKPVAVKTAVKAAAPKPATLKPATLKPATPRPATLKASKAAVAAGLAAKAKTPRATGAMH